MADKTGGMELDPKYDNYDFPIVTPTEQSGYPGHLTEQQQAQVHQLRLMLEAQGYTKRLDTLTLLRFLRARKFDVNLALKMFVDCEKWRDDTGLDGLLSGWKEQYADDKDKLRQYYPQYYHKTDIDGRPVYVELLGKINLVEMNKITTNERMLINLAVEYERLTDSILPSCSRKAGHLLETCCTIMDMKGVGLTKIPEVYGYVQAAAALSQNYYPERLGKFYMINAPWGFSGIWSIIKGWLDPVTVAKIHILGSGYQKELLAQVPAENLPKRFGGSCECDHLYGCEGSDMGPWRDSEWARPAAWELPAKPEDAPAAAATSQPPAETAVQPDVTLQAPGAAGEPAAEGSTDKAAA